MGGYPLPNLYPLYSQRPHLPSFFWSGLRGRSHLLLSCCCGPSSLCKGMVSWGAAPPKLRPPLPHRYTPLPSRSREATHLSFLSLGMAQDLGLELRPGWTTSRHRGEHGPQRGPESSSSTRAPLPPPARAAAVAGASRARRPAGKMADGPGWLVTRRRRRQPATLGPNLRLGDGGPAALQEDPRSITALGAGAASVSLSTPTPDLSLTATPAGAPRADTSGDRVTRPRPTPTRARSGRIRSGRLGVVGVPGVQAARTRSCVRRRQARSSGQEADGGREAGGGRRRPSARRWRDPRLPPTPRWLSSRLLLRPASSGTFKNPSARHRPRPALAPRPEGCEPLSGRRRPGARPVAARTSEELWWGRGFPMGVFSCGRGLP